MLLPHHEEMKSLMFLYQAHNNDKEIFQLIKKHRNQKKSENFYRGVKELGEGDTQITKMALMKI